MRIGEVVVFGTSNIEIEQFIEAICQFIQQKDNKICYANLEINDQLILYLYGIQYQDQPETIAWDMLSNKVLGYIFIFNWYQPESLNQIMDLLDYVNEKCAAPIIFAANVANQPSPLPDNLFQDGISLNFNEKLLFCRAGDSATCKKALVALLDIIIDKL